MPPSQRLTPGIPVVDPVFILCNLGQPTLTTCGEKSFSLAQSWPRVSRWYRLPTQTPVGSLSFFSTMTMRRGEVHTCSTSCSCGWIELDGSDLARKYRGRPAGERFQARMVTALTSRLSS